MFDVDNPIESLFAEEVQKKFSGGGCCLLQFQPQYEKYFTEEFHEKLSGDDWCGLLQEHPQFLSLIPKNFKLVLNCGDEKRAIWIDVKEPNIIHIGCFSGTKERAIRAISGKYTGKERDDYIAKVEECFGLVK